MENTVNASAAEEPLSASLRQARERWLQQFAAPRTDSAALPRPETVGIVGGGMAGLYAALLLQRQGIAVTVFEAHPSRLGGRIYTHRFNDEPYQYFEAGAMRLPQTAEQQPVFDLIAFLNQQRAGRDEIRLIPYVLFDDNGNRVCVNGRRMSVAEANQHPRELGFPLHGPDADKTAAQLLDEALKPFLDRLSADFDAGFLYLMQYDNMSLYTYLAQELGWSEAKINYAETMTSQSNQFQNSLTELVIENMDFSNAHWKTIDGGMDQLPLACAELIGREHIHLDAPVRKLAIGHDGKAELWVGTATQPQRFDRVIMALPTAALRMIDTPLWPVAKRQAIRSLHFEPLYKIGLRFRRRFWEQVAAPSHGGQSISDFPSRWCVYPSYDIGGSGAGVLLLYSWMTDAYQWLPQQRAERVRLALRDLGQMYAGEVDIEAEFIEAFDVAWPTEWATGDAMFFPGQFRNLFNVAREAEGVVHFAGEHLSVHHTWIVGALDSALTACRQILPAADLQTLAATA